MIQELNSTMIPVLPSYRSLVNVEIQVKKLPPESLSTPFKEWRSCHLRAYLLTSKSGEVATGGPIFSLQTVENLPPEGLSTPFKEWRSCHQRAYLLPSKSGEVATRGSIYSLKTVKEEVATRGPIFSLQRVEKLPPEGLPSPFKEWRSCHQRVYLLPSNSEEVATRGPIYSLKTVKEEVATRRPIYSLQRVEKLPPEGLSTPFKEWRSCHQRAYLLP